MVSLLTQSALLQLSTEAEIFPANSTMAGEAPSLCLWTRTSPSSLASSSPIDVRAMAEAFSISSETKLLDVACSMVE